MSTSVLDKREGIGQRFARRADWDRNHRPHGMVTAVAIGPDRNLYAFGGAAPSRGVPASVTVYSPDGGVVRTWGEGEFDTGRAHGITIAGGESVYLVEDAGCRVRRFDLDGTELAVIGPSGEDCRSDTGVDWDVRDLRARLRMMRPDGAGPFNHPTALAVGANGLLYVSDGYGNCKVHCFAADGAYVTSWGRSGQGPAEFRLPHGITAAGDHLLVCDRENDRIQVFDLDGAYLTEWTGLHRPENVAIGPDGHYYIAEGYEPAGYVSFAHGPNYRPRPSRVSIRDADGTELGHVEVGFRLHHVAVDSDGNLYCCPSTPEADSRIVRFVRVG